MRQRPAIVEAPSPHHALIAEWNFLDGSINPNFGGATPTFTRSGATATRVNSAGLIEVVAADTPRFDYDPVTLAIRGLLIEEARTNLLLQSAEFDNGSWGKVAASVTANAATSPDGSTVADKLVEDTANSPHFIHQSVAKAASAITYTASVFAKAGERTELALWMDDAVGPAANVLFDLSAGTAGTPSLSGFTSGSATITDFGNGWYRCTLTATSNTVTTVRHIIELRNDSDSVYTGDGTSGVYIWGAQLEAGAFPTSYIPATSASATRPADVCTVATSLISGFSSSELMMYGAAYSLTDVVDQHALAFLHTDSGNYVGLLRRISGAINGTVNNLGVIQFTDEFGGWTAGSVHKAALAASTDDFVLASDGVLGTPDAAGSLPAMGTLQIGAFPGGALAWGAPICALRLYNRRPIDSEVEATA